MAAADPSRPAPLRSEEEELADLEEALSLKKIQDVSSDGGYLSMDEVQSKPWESADVGEQARAGRPVNDGPPPLRAGGSLFFSAPQTT